MELCRNFTIEDDIVVEEPQEQFGLMLFTSDSAVLFSRQTASITIIDNDSMCIRSWVKWLFTRPVIDMFKLIHINLMSGTPKDVAMYTAKQK